MGPRWIIQFANFLFEMLLLHPLTTSSLNVSFSLTICVWLTQGEDTNCEFTVRVSATQSLGTTRTAWGKMWLHIAWCYLHIDYTFRFQGKTLMSQQRMSSHQHMTQNGCQIKILCKRCCPVLVSQSRLYLPDWFFRTSQFISTPSIRISSVHHHLCSPWSLTKQVHNTSSD